MQTAPGQNCRFAAPVLLKYGLSPYSTYLLFFGESIDPENDGHECKQIEQRADHWLFKVSLSKRLGANTASVMPALTSGVPGTAACMPAKPNYGVNWNW